MTLSENYLKRLARLEPYTELWSDDGKFIEHRAALYATLYFEHTHPMAASEEHLRLALIECWHDYWNVVGLENWKWVYRFAGDAVPGFRVPTNQVPPIDTYLKDPGNFNGYQYYGFGGNHKCEASSYCYDLAAFPIHGGPESPGEFGHLRLQAPLSFIADGRMGEFVALVKRCVARVQPNQAYGGLGFARTYNEESTTRRTEGQLAKIFSGVDVDVPYVQANRLYCASKGVKGISGAHWLNFLADEWIEKLGGLEALRKRLPEDVFVVESYPGGVFIQAGPYPEPGHKEDGFPPAYVRLNRVLMPIRVARFGYHMGSTLGELALPEDWEPYFRRFDRVSEELAEG